MTIPDDAIRYRIAVDVPCDSCRPWDPYPCPLCNGHGTRTVVTDVEVYPVAHACENDFYDAEDSDCRPDVADYWKPA